MDSSPASYPCRGCPSNPGTAGTIDFRFRGQHAARDRTEEHIVAQYRVKLLQGLDTVGFVTGESIKARYFNTLKNTAAILLFDEKTLEIPISGS